MDHRPKNETQNDRTGRLHRGHLDDLGCGDTSLATHQRHDS